MTNLRCAVCGEPLAPGEGYVFRGRTLCAECCLDARLTRPRKTHWQYLSAIRSGYLQEGEGKKGKEQ